VPRDDAPDVDAHLGGGARRLGRRARARLERGSERGRSAAVVANDELGVIESNGIDSDGDEPVVGERRPNDPRPENVDRESLDDDDPLAFGIGHRGIHSADTPIAELSEALDGHLAHQCFLELGVGD
jgi:hypothetical protein